MLVFMFTSVNFRYYWFSYVAMFLLILGKVIIDSSSILLILHQVTGDLYRLPNF